MTLEIQSLVIRNLIKNDTYTRTVSPHLKREYFDNDHAALFKVVGDYTRTYNCLPDKDAIVLEVNSSPHITAAMLPSINGIIDTVFDGKANKTDWMIDVTEKWCQDRALQLAIIKSVEVIDGRDNNLTKDALPSILQDALNVCFDKNVGHDYFADAAARHDFYTRHDARIPFNLNILDDITEGGLPDKTLSVLMAGIHVGKSLSMCSMAANNLSDGKNVLYISLEMSEEEIGKRIDANLLDININSLKTTSKERFMGKVGQARSKSQGELKFKQFPTGSAHVGNFRALLNDLSMKSDFVPDVIYVDYINLMASSRLKASSASDSYLYIQSIAQELRGLAIEFDLPVVTATQVNRTGYAMSDVDMTNVAESFGLPATADFMIAITTTEELSKSGQFQFKILKNRLGDTGNFEKFVMGVDYYKMRLYDVDAKAQTLTGTGKSSKPAPDIPVMDLGRNAELTDKFKGFKYDE